jgi:hypothetical protein
MIFIDAAISFEGSLFFQLIRVDSYFFSFPIVRLFIRDM